MRYRLFYFHENELIWKPLEDFDSESEARYFDSVWSHDGFLMKVELISNTPIEAEKPSHEDEWISLGESLRRGWKDISGHVPAQIL